MNEGIDKLHETMQRIERLLARFELDMAGRLHVVDYQASIAMLCEEFEAQMRGLTEGAPDPGGRGCQSGRSITHGFGISHIKSGEST